MGLKDNELPENRIHVERFPRPGNLRGEAEGFVEGVHWLLRHLHSFRFISVAEENYMNEGWVEPLAEAIKEAKRLYPPYDPLPEPDKKGERTGF